METKKTLYTGEKLKTRYPENATGKDIILHPYLPDADLIEAVNIAILLERPLLVMGDAGCGKSLLAHAVAFELFHNKVIDGVVQNYKDWLFEWTIKSTSKAKEGLYEYEALSRLLDVQLANSVESSKNKAANTDNYIKKRDMALAMIKSTDENRAVLLIDEIDKADPDFPNDLLAELEGRESKVVETGEAIVKNPIKPIIIITSNREKELPEAFLRRCIYYFIPPFDEERLKNILKYRFYLRNSTKIDKPSEDLIADAVKAFEKARLAILSNKTSVKKISTSELIDWFEAMKKMIELTGKTDEMARFAAEIQAFLTDNQKTLPLQQALFKNFETNELFKTPVAPSVKTR